MRLAALLSFLLLGACATAERDQGSFLDGDKPHAITPEKDTGSCRPFFIKPSLDWGEGSAKHSCWHRLWEIPAALVAVPVALGVLTAPIWVPILLL